MKVPVPVIQLQWQAALAHDTGDRLGTVTRPTTVLHGTADAGIPVVNGHRLACLIPGAQLELFDGAGHLFWWEDPARTATVLTELERRAADRNDAPGWTT